MKVYSLSFFLVGFYAFFQFFLSLIGIDLPGVCQYIALIGRAQALTYEPSYYALYMAPFVTFSTLQYMQDSSRGVWRCLIGPHLFFLVSTSTGCFFAYLFLLGFLLVFKRLKLVDFSLFSFLKKFGAAFGILFALFTVVQPKLLSHAFLKFFYLGFSTHHSFSERWEGLVAYWNIFLEHPLIGVGLGAGPFQYAKQMGYSISSLDPDIVAKFCCTNVFTETLASLGLYGALWFVMLFALLIQTFKAALKNPSITKEEKDILISLAVSICVMLAMLQFNQSIMRCYLWVHMGIFVGYARILQQKTLPICMAE